MVQFALHFLVVPLEPSAGMSYAINGYIVLEYYHTAHRYVQHARLLDMGRLRSMGLLVIRVPHHIIEDPATVDKRCVYKIVWNFCIVANLMRCSIGTKVHPMAELDSVGRQSLRKLSVAK